MLQIIPDETPPKNHYTYRELYLMRIIPDGIIPDGIIPDGILYLMRRRFVRKVKRSKNKNTLILCVRLPNAKTYFNAML